MRFPIGRRVIDTVVKEITPLLGPYGKIVPLPASTQVQVSDTAGVMRSVKALIESIVEPATAASTAVLVLAHYPIKPADPETVQAAFKALFPTTKVAYDEQSGQLHVYASAAEQTIAERLIADMRSGNAAEKQARLEVYAVGETVGPQVLAVLKTILPKAILALDAKTGKIAAWGPPGDQETIKQTIVRLQAAQPDPNARELSFRVFKQPPPADLLTILSTAVPHATIRLDTEGKRLTIVATPDDQVFLKSLLDRYEKIAPPEDKNQLAFYPVTPEQKTRFQAVMVTLATDLPGTKVVADAEPGELAVWAKPEQQAMLRGILDQLRQEPPPERKVAAGRLFAEVGQPYQRGDFAGDDVPGRQARAGRQDAKDRRLGTASRARRHHGGDPTTRRRRAGQRHGTRAELPFAHRRSDGGHWRVGGASAPGEVPKRHQEQLDFRPGPASRP